MPAKSAVKFVNNPAAAAYFKQFVDFYAMNLNCLKLQSTHLDNGLVF
jgi:hypothetical protein